MKNYALNYNDYKMFILSYEINGDKIIINFADGDKSEIPYTLDNEKKILEKMKKQVLIGDINKSKFKKKVDNSSTLTLLYLILLVDNLLILTEGISASPIISKILIIFFSLMSIKNIYTMIKNKIKLRDLEKNIAFLSNQDKLNKMIKENKNVLKNVNNKTKEVLKPVIEKNKEININDVDKINYYELNKIMNDISRIEDYDFNNNESKEKNKVLTKKR